MMPQRSAIFGLCLENTNAESAENHHELTHRSSSLLAKQHLASMLVHLELTINTTMVGETTFINW